MKKNYLVWQVEGAEFTPPQCAVSAAFAAGRKYYFSLKVRWFLKYPEIKDVSLEVKVPFVVKVKKELKDERLGIPSVWTGTA